MGPCVWGITCDPHDIEPGCCDEDKQPWSPRSQGQIMAKCRAFVLIVVGAVAASSSRRRKSHPPSKDHSGSCLSIREASTSLWVSPLILPGLRTPSESLYPDH